MDTEAFLRAISKRPSIWMSKHPHHKFRNVNKRLWQEIGKEFPRMEVEDLKKKWKNLRDTYRKEVKKPFSCTGDPELNIQSQWRYFEAMEFLREEMLAPPEEDFTSDTINDSELHDTTEIPSPRSNTSPLPSPVDRSHSSQVTVKSETPSRTSLSQTSSQSEGDPLQYRSHKSRKRPRESNDVQTEYVEMDLGRDLELSQQNNIVGQDIQESDDYHFLMSLLPHLEKLPALNKIRLRNKINQALLDEMVTVSYRVYSS